MDTLVDPFEKHAKRSSEGMKAQVPEPMRSAQSSMSDEVQVQWFARTGQFPVAPATTAPPRVRFPSELEAEISDDDIESAEPLSGITSTPHTHASSDQDSDTLVAATRPWVRGRIWSSED